MSIPFTVRRATSEDAAPLAAFAARTFYEAFGEFVPADSMTRYLTESFNLAQITDDLNTPDSIFLLAIAPDGQFAGYARVHFGNPLSEVRGPNPVKLWRLYTACEWQGKGVGRALLIKAVNVAAERNGQTLWLTVNQENENAIAFYQKNGFQQTGHTTFLLGNEVHQDFVMERPI